MPRRVRTRSLSEWRDPEAVFRAWYADAPYAVWLDGGSDAASGVSVLASAHAGSEFVTADVASGTVTRSTPMRGDRDEVTVEASVFEVLAEQLAGSLPTADHEVGGPLGWFGWFGYELGARLNGVPVEAADTPDAAFLFVDRAIVFDHGTRSVRLVWIDPDDAEQAGQDDAAEVHAWADSTSAALQSPLEESAMAAPKLTASTPVDEDSAAQAPGVRWRHGPNAYASLIAECQAAILRGDAYQLCLTNRIDIEARPDPAETYLALRASSPSHHAGYLRFGAFALLSASPEQFLHVEPDGLVSTKPMKGTRPRSPDPALDAVLRRELLESEKEQAENLMIVDLMRNDLGRIAELGSVSVPSLLDVEEYAHVHQLVSTVTARLRHPLTALDVVQAAFPAGSMTGAPKHSAMTILHELERGPRGVYSGTFGYLGIDGSADLAMVIRSIVLTPDGASIGTGGGITALSVADDEIEETRVKARALLAVLGAAMPHAE
ncbi:aminodeoxychorismate synthase component I [Agromyces sp. ISL-38]|uniref:aminodeoxychorismate synthase component I n=1 Tax=Agromyces sp. ISL-38 TaxID=2819107 RepID=UPI001BE7F809|nr:aminodeoxychorismate synthase component I [Agromyces sp. ISL-38]MBT2498481.1 aminodeoxychorismate synthase component I [Agromyces sp. ISL-38]